MNSHQLLLAALLAALIAVAQAQETLLGAFVLHRHGDRTSKSWPPARLTDLGYSQVYQDGTWYRSRYLSGTTSGITGMETDIAKLSQLSVQAPVDIVLQAAAMGWLQGLYPPVGAAKGSQQLANGTTIEAPLNGYQLIPINGVTAVASGADLENTVWLQGSSGCANAIFSSNSYFFSKEYQETKNNTDSFYQRIYPVVNGSFTEDYTSFKNAFAVFDLINVATINNATINSSALLTPDVLHQLHALANQHEFGLAYNSSEPIRAIAGATLAAQILDTLNQTISSRSAPRLNVQFNAYASFLAFFGLTKLTQVSENFTGIVDYTSSMAFELVTNSTVSSTSYPTPDQISVRFLFSNGSAAENGLTTYPLFGQSQTTLPWSNFSSEMSKIAIGDRSDWCTKCGNTTGVCANLSETASSPSSSSSAASSGGSGGSAISTAVGGVIGAMVTLAVILGVEALVILAGGFRLVRKGSRATSPVISEVGPAKAQA